MKLSDEQKVKVQAKIDFWKTKKDEAEKNLKDLKGELINNKGLHDFPDGRNYAIESDRLLKDVEVCQKRVVILQKFLDGKMDFKTYKQLHERALTLYSILEKLKKKEKRIQEKINQHLLLKMLVSDVI